MTQPTTTPSPQQPSTPAAPTAPAAPAAPAQPAAPAAPTGAPAQAPATSGQGGTPQQQPTEPKTFTQDELEGILKDRLGRERQGWEARLAEQNKALAAALGYKDPAAAPDPADAVKAAQASAEAALQRADTASARALAIAAGIPKESIPVFMRLVDVAGALKDVDRADDAAVETALQAAVDEALAAAPAFKASPVAASSGGDRSAVTSDGKKIWTRDELAKLSEAELIRHADDIASAQAEGRIR